MIIGLAGKKYSGKDTAGLFFKENGYIRIAFADPLKEICQIAFGLTDEELYHDKEKIVDEWQVSSRKLMQIVGTELFRNELAKQLPRIGESIWLRIAEKKIKQAGQNVVITDVRYENEAAMIRRLGGKIVYVDRKTDHIDDHTSEKIIEYDYSIENNGTLDEFYDLLNCFLNRL